MDTPRGQLQNNNNDRMAFYTQLVLNNMRRACKCHGVSGACTAQICWLQLPSFREVANQLHDKFDQAIQLQPYYLARLPSGASFAANINSSPGSSQRKSNKKRSSQSAPYNSTLMQPNSYYSNRTTGGAQIRRPVARSIVMERQQIQQPQQQQQQQALPSKQDLIYQLQSPDFCKRSDTYNIKGTRGRACVENPQAPDRCDRLCCGRGYKTEVREEKYNCECIFKFCCDLVCKTCTRRKVVHKCL